MASDAKILQLIARVALFTVESTILELTYQTVIRSCYKPVKIISNARWERTLPKGLQRFSGALNNCFTRLIYIYPCCLKSV